MNRKEGFLAVGGRSLVVLIVVCLCFSTPLMPAGNAAAEQGVPRTVLLELFTATWCGPCARYGHNMDELVQEFGADRVVLLRNQVWNDGLNTPDTDGRCKQYGISGVPHCMVDGACGWNPYEKEAIAGRIATELAMPASAQLDVVLTRNGGASSTGLVSVTMKAVASLPSDTRLYVVILENPVEYRGTNGVPVHHDAVRRYMTGITGLPVSLQTGIAQTKAFQFMIDSTWKSDRIECAAWLQTGTTGQVLQAAWTIEPDASSEQKPVWSALRGGVYGGGVADLAQDPVDPAIFYAACELGGLWRSTDRGSTWTEISAQLNGGRWANRVCSAVDGSGLVWAATGTGLKVSSDKGATWRSTACQSSGIVVIVPIVSGGILVCSNYGGVLRLNADGTKVSVLASAGRQLPEDCYLTALGADQANGRLLIVGGQDVETSGAFLRRSTDGGATWSTVTVPSAVGSGWNLEIAVSSGAIPVVALTTGEISCFSTDAGTTWTTAGSAPYVYRLLQRSADGRVVALTSAGIAFPADGGRGWDVQILIPTHETTRAVVLDRTDSQRMLGASWGADGILLSTDHGRTWMPTTGLTSWSAWGLMGSFAAPRALSTFGIASWEAGSWSLLSSEPTQGEFVSDADDPRHAVIMSPSSLQSTRNGGSTWQKLLPIPAVGRYSYVTSLSYDVATDTALTCYSDGSIWLSQKGAAWNRVSVDGLPTTVDTGSVALVAGQDHITFLLGTSYDYTGKQGGVFRVAQSGSTWSGTCILRGWITGLWIDPGHAGTWYAAASGALKRTSDAGITWETVLSGEVGAMAFSRDGTCAYAGMGSTLYCSTDSGASWNVVLWDRSADPCVPSSITCILIDDAQPLNTIIGTAGTGIYRCQRAQTVPASGTVNVVATLDGSPWTGSVNVRASGALNKTVTAVPFTEGDVPEGDLTLARVSGGPSGANFVGISPSVRQAVVAGGTTTFTLAFETPPPPVSVVVLKIGSGIATVGGRAVTLDAPAEIATGRTFVPLRFIAEAFGAQIEWNPVSRGIIAELDGHRVGLQIANQSGVVNGAMMRLDAPPYIRNGRTMVPLRFISEAFGADVQWDPVTRTVTITYTPT